MNDRLPQLRFVCVHESYPLDFLRCLLARLYDYQWLRLAHRLLSFGHRWPPETNRSVDIQSDTYRFTQPILIYVWWTLTLFSCAWPSFECVFGPWFTNACVCATLSTSPSIVTIESFGSIGSTNASFSYDYKLEIKCENSNILYLAHLK